MRAALSVLLVCGLPLAAADSEEVAAAVQKLFDAMAANDAAKAEEVLLPEGRLVSVRRDGERTVVGGNTHQSMIERLRSGKEPLHERMWDWKVEIHGDIATLTAPYDFHRAGKFSHCGVDVVNLARVNGAWKIAGLIYTVQTTGCRPSPLGPPKP